MKKFFLWIFGCLCLVIGVAGIILPILPGWFLIFVGLSIVAPRQAIRLKRMFQRRFSKQETIQLDEWRRRGVKAGFTTRHFKLFLQKTDDLLVPANQEKFKMLKRGNRFVFLNQVHEDSVLVLDDKKAFEKEGFYHFLRADGIITNVPDLTLLIMTADCLPIFFSAPGWVGLVHAGWRGSQKGISKKAVELICEKAGCKASKIQVALGPSISKKYYEVGREFRDYFPQESLVFAHNKLYFDLAGENKRQLLEAGITKANILDTKLCTVGQNKHYFSFRKEKDAAGRIISFISFVQPRVRKLKPVS